jgi:hypothetical protein
MPEHNLFHIFVSRLNKLAVNYMITGAVASIIYGEPRVTNDIDLVIDLKDSEAEQIVGAFPIEEFYCPPAEVIELEIRRSERGHFNLIHHESGFKADMYTSGRGELHNWGLQHRKKVNVEGEDFWIAPVEYVILRKLEYFREGGSEKHLRDIAGMLALTSKNIDFAFINEKIKMMVLEKEWQAANDYKT